VEKWNWHWRHPGALLIGFLVLLALGMCLVIPHWSHYHGDEGFYTNAAIRMTQTGDYWTPYYADGAMRFVKPILTYWAIAGSYLLFGIGIVSSRLPFVVAGCLAVYLTFRLSLVLFNRPQSALLAAWIAGTNLQWFTLSTRSTPDILVILFALMSWLGLARILFRGDDSFSAYLLTWAGAGLAVQTKGLLGLFPIACGLLLVIAFRDRQLNPWRLLNVPALLIGAVLASFWYVIVAAKNGSVVFSQFFSDQLTAKVSYNPWFSLQNLVSYWWAGLRHFLPWTLILAGVAILNRQGLTAFVRQHKKECLFLLGPFLLLGICFCFGNMRRTRYVALSYPLLAVLLAESLLYALDHKLARTTLRRGLKWAAAGVLVIAAVIGLATIRIELRAFFGAIAVALAAGGLFRVVRRDLQPTWAAALTGFLLTSFVVIEHLWRPLFSVSPIPELASRLLEAELGRAPVYVCDAHSGYADQLRICSAGRLNVIASSPIDPILPGPMILTEQQSQGVSRSDWAMEPVGFGSHRRSAKEWLKVTTHPGAISAFNREQFYIAWPLHPMRISPASSHAKVSPGQSFGGNSPNHQNLPTREPGAKPL
jgi:4-amino-4-deoxy-L-arabinose transferase-like glycosyltransferase